MTWASTPSAASYSAAAAPFLPLFERVPRVAVAGERLGVSLRIWSRRERRRRRALLLGGRRLRTWRRGSGRIAFLGTRRPASVGTKPADRSREPAGSARARRAECRRLRARPRRKAWASARPRPRLQRGSHTATATAATARADSIVSCPAERPLDEAEAACARFLAGSSDVSAAVSTNAGRRLKPHRGRRNAGAATASSASVWPPGPPARPQPKVAGPLAASRRRLPTATAVSPAPGRPTSPEEGGRSRCLRCSRRQAAEAIPRAARRAARPGNRGRPPAARVSRGLLAG